MDRFTPLARSKTHAFFFCSNRSETRHNSRFAMAAAPQRIKMLIFALLFCAAEFSMAQETATVAPEEKPPIVEKFEEPAPPAPGQTNGADFRFTYPVRDAASDQIYTEANPPATGDLPKPQADQPPAATTEESRQAVDATMAATVSSSFEAAPAVSEEQIVAEEDLPIPPPADIGEGRFEKRPFRYSFAVYEGYNSNVNASPTDQVESLYTSVAAGFDYIFGSSRLKMDLSLDAALAFYYNNNQLQNDGLFPTITLGLGADYKALPQLDLSFTTSTSLLSQPNYSGGGGGPASYIGNYVMSQSTLAATYRWLPKFQTVTSYSPFLQYYFQAQGDNFSYFDQTIGQQFLFLWKPTTQLVAEYRFNLRDYFDLTDYNSLGNYALLGFNHSLNPRSSLVFRAGAEQRISQNPVAGGNYNYIGPFGTLDFNYALGKNTQVALNSRYGTTGTGVNNYSLNQQLLIGLSASHRIGRRLNVGGFANFQNNYYAQPGGEINGVDLTPSFYYNVFNAGLNAGYYIMPEKWSLQAGYSFTGVLSGDTDQQGNYTQNIIFLGTQLDF